jgi:hypothetical protein
VRVKTPVPGKEGEEGGKGGAGGGGGEKKVFLREQDLEADRGFGNLGL